MFKRMTRGWLLRAGIASAMGAAAILVAISMGAFSGSAQAAPGDAVISVSGGGNQAIGATFDVFTNLTNSTPIADEWAGWHTEVGFNAAILQMNSTSSGGLCAPAANWGGPPQIAPGLWRTGCAFQDSTASSPPSMDDFNFTCIGSGTTAIHLVSPAEDPTFGGTAINDVNALDFPTDLVDGSVTCNLPITKTNNAPAGGAVAGTSVQYTVHIGNPGSVSIPGQTLGDIVPAPLTGVTIVSSTNGALDGCSVVTGNTVLCTSDTIQPDPTGFDLVIGATIPLSAAGTNNICNAAQEGNTVPPTGSVSAPSCFNVLPASTTVTKTADAGPYQAGDPISWTITVNSTGGSPAANVNVADTASDGFAITAATGTANCTAGAVTAGAVSFSCGNLTSTDGPQVLQVSGTVDDPQPADNTCNNDVAVTADNATTSNASASVACLSKNVQMVKSVGPASNAGNPVNLFLCKGVNCATNNPSVGFTNCSATAFCSLVINENALNVGGDPQGVGAFEFDLLYDNRIFNVGVAATNWLYATNRIPGDAGIGGCSATIITENDVRFGCVSKNPQPLSGANGSCLGTDNVTLVAGAVCGNKSNGVIATITLTPKSDLASRITPGNDNGAIRTLLDQGCEFADIWGHPLSAAIGAPTPGVAGNGYDALGREEPLPGIAPGGQVINCGSQTINVRMLEGDMNVDCTVDVTDDQTEAAHYGATFGVLLYEPAYDLEPALKDGDVDIKDLQKVFGRNGSTCATPVPPQPALPEPIDP